MTPPNPNHITHNVRLLLGGQNWDHYEGTYQVLTAILMGLKNAGFGRNPALVYLRNHPGSGAERLKEKWMGGFDSQVMSRWAAIERKDATHQEDVIKWLQHLNMTFNIPRGGPTFRVALALAKVSQTAGTLTFTASVRQLSEIAGVGAATINGASHKTTRRAIRRLLEGGWIRCEQSTHPSKISQFSLILEEHVKCPITPREPVRSNGVVSRNGEQQVSHDSKPKPANTWSRPYIVGQFDLDEALSEVFSPAGLGMNAFRAMTCVRKHTSLTAAKLAKETGMPPSSVHTALNALCKQQMVVRDETGIWHFVGTPLRLVEEALGLTNRPQLRREAFARERRNFEHRFSRHPLNESLTDSTPPPPHAPPSLQKRNSEESPPN